MRPYLEKPGQRELKIPLGAKTIMTKEAFQKWEDAKRAFDRNVKAARAAKQRHETLKLGMKDALSPGRVAQLAKAFHRNWHLSDEEALRDRGADFSDLTREAWDWLLPEFQEWRATGDLEAMEGQWGKFADALIASEGLVVDPDDTDGRERLLWAMNDVALEYADDAQARARGKLVKVPPKPEGPANPKGGARTVSALLDAYKAAKWQGWSKSSHNAIGPVFRVLKDTIGDREVAKIDRAAACEVFELVQVLPLNMGRGGSFQG